MITYWQIAVASAGVCVVVIVNAVMWLAIQRKARALRCEMQKSYGDDDRNGDQG